LLQVVVQVVVLRLMMIVEKAEAVLAAFVQL
jgi:hypothetical protein